MNDNLNHNINEQIRFTQVIEILIRQKKTIIITFLLILFATAAYTLTRDKLYEATATIIVESNEAEKTLGLTSSITNDRTLQNEMEILESRDLGWKVSEKMVRRFYLDPETRKDTLQIIKQALLKAPGIDINTDNFLREVAQTIKNNMWINAKEASNIIKFGITSPDATEAALLANTYVETYNENDLLNSRSNATELRSFLEEQNRIKTEKLSKSDSSLQRYLQTAEIKELDTESSLLANKIASLESELEANELDYKNSILLLEEYKKELTKLAPKISKKMASVDDIYIAELQKTIAKKEADRDILKLKASEESMGPQFSIMLNDLNNTIDSLTAILKERSKGFYETSVSNYSITSNTNNSNNYVSELSGEIQRLETKIASLDLTKNILYDNLVKYESRLNTLPKQTIELAKLQRERLFNEKLYLKIGEKYEEALLAEKSSFGKVNIIDKAIVPTEPVTPNIKFNFIIGILAGLSIGIILAFIFSFVNNQIHTPKDLENMGFRLISTIPKLKLENGNGKRLIAETANNSEGLIKTDDPNSVIYESFLRLGINLAYSFIDNKYKSLLVTSAGPGAGKSATAINVAITLANLGKKVLLVDTDIRRPVVHKYFKKQMSPGLTDYLLDQKDFKEVAHKTMVKGLTVITCGGRLLNPSLILSSGKMQNLMLKESEEYDFIIYDAPPLNPVTDAIHLAKHVDQIILVVRAEQTHIEELKRAQDLLNQVNVKIGGVVLNDFDPSKAPLTYGKRYGYYYYHEDNHKKGIFRKRKTKSI